MVGERRFTVAWNGGGRSGDHNLQPLDRAREGEKKRRKEEEV